MFTKEQKVKLVAIIRGTQTLTKKEKMEYCQEIRMLGRKVKL